MGTARATMAVNPRAIPRTSPGSGQGRLAPVAAPGRRWSAPLPTVNSSEDDGYDGYKAEQGAERAVGGWPEESACDHIEEEVRHIQGGRGERNAVPPPPANIDPRATRTPSWNNRRMRSRLMALDLGWFAATYPGGHGLLSSPPARCDG